MKFSVFPDGWTNEFVFSSLSLSLYLFVFASFQFGKQSTHSKISLLVDHIVSGINLHSSTFHHQCWCIAFVSALICYHTATIAERICIFL